MNRGGGVVDLGGDEVGLGRIGGVIDKELGTESCQMKGDGSPNTTGGACYNGYSILQVKGSQTLQWT